MVGICRGFVKIFGTRPRATKPRKKMDWTILGQNWVQPSRHLSVLCFFGEENFRLLDETTGSLPGFVAFHVSYGIV